MSIKFIHDLKIRKRLKPKIRLKHWHVIFICRRCGKIIDKKFIFSRDLLNTAELIFCSDCAVEMLTKMFKVYPKKVEETEVFVEELAEKN